jgi:hypothetical protein
MVFTSQKRIDRMKQDVEKWGEVIELNSENTGPIVFHFRPTKFLKVAPEYIHEWEEIFSNYVGLPPDKKHLQSLNPNGWSGDPKETISGSNGDWDDCDYW